MKVCLYNAFGCDEVSLSEACAKSSSSTEAGAPNATFNSGLDTQQEVSSAVENGDGVSKQNRVVAWAHRVVTLGGRGRRGEGWIPNSMDVRTRTIQLAYERTQRCKVNPGKMVLTTLLSHEPITSCVSGATLAMCVDDNIGENEQHPSGTGWSRKRNYGWADCHASEDAFPSPCCRSSCFRVPRRLMKSLYVLLSILKYNRCQNSWYTFFVACVSAIQRPPTCFWSCLLGSGV